MAIQNILIDLDGTLTDPKVGITTSIRYGLEKVGYPVAEDVSLDWCIGPPLKQALAKILNTDDDALAEQALQMYRERFSVTGLFENEVYPDVANTLMLLHQRGYRLFVATAKPTVYAKRILEYFDLAKYFQHIYGSELTGERTNKGDLIAYILQQQNLLVEQCIMIGDREHDILGAKRHGINTIAVRYGYGTQQEIDAAQPFAQVNGFSELLDYFHSH
ncbi:HAD-IA family hydrolase [Acinetobacter qingfengensis]|uniref:Hydrolase n=1 Tax=Acinetobacter qingfengensis TaxID=1262585 RepID=A0A1E7RCS5_9GAMM|nr:HAD-IA family hydrolase [Acinetobacter qingfengensis]KAA8734330.1 HAD-IA family hydrolase [Acinetobacter qingfengensis]OEY97093.1 hydrolase [Acinetobacter qingfengensis]